MTATYPSRPFPAADPARLLAAARLHGAGEWDEQRVRYLDLGCGTGGNALAVAARRPEATVLGIDADAVAIAQAAELADTAGLGAQLTAGDLRTAEVEPAAWDVVLLHGVLSWVDDDVAAAALALAARAVAPGGVVAVSYHALPGYRLHEVARDVVSGAPDATTAVARLALAAELNRSGAVYGSILAAEAQRCAARHPAVLEQDELAAVVRPYSVRALAGAARGAGLHVAGEALPEQWWRWRAPEAAERIRDAAGADLVEQEQLADAAFGTAFKLTLLSPQPATGPAADATTELYAIPGSTLAAVPAGADRRFLETLGATLDARTVADVARRAGMDPEAAAGVALRLAGDGQLVLSAAAPPSLPLDAQRPCVHPLARAQAARGTDLTTLRHTHVEASDPMVSELLARLDGSRDRAAIAAELLAIGEHHGRSDDAQRAAASLGETLDALAQLGLLCSR